MPFMLTVIIQNWQGKSSREKNMSGSQRKIIEKSLKVPFKLLINAFSILRKAFKIEKGGV